ncbi:hypothetical protein QVD17_06952 [Tagetes erecta]|uniref:Homeobox-leucine zipper protein n=1 Tax=Tagetes erecta TaxID=13708 RepID=A0AAD8LHW8_TARER|nr:hypothetical protein QVD17_06952 [Tagetes erecta]
MPFLGDGDCYFQGTRVGQFTMEESSKKRPFFSSIDDMVEEEYYDEQLTEKKRHLTHEQVRMLEKSFEEENKLEPERKTELAKKLGLQPRQVAVWYQNRRARWKTKTLERDYNHLKSCYDILKSDYKSIAKENENLKAEIFLEHFKEPLSTRVNVFVTSLVLYVFISLTKKLEPKDVLGTSIVGQDSNSAIGEVGDIPAPSDKIKVEDHLSVGHGGSAVVDDYDGPQLLDSGDSYFPDDSYLSEYVVVYVDRSEEDDGGDDGHKHFRYPFETTDHEDNDALGWWVWS